MLPLYFEFVTFLEIVYKHNLVKGKRSVWRETIVSKGNGAAAESVLVAASLGYRISTWAGSLAVTGTQSNLNKEEEIVAPKKKQSFRTPPSQHCLSLSVLIAVSNSDKVDERFIFGVLVTPEWEVEGPQWLSPGLWAGCAVSVGRMHRWPGLCHWPFPGDGGRNQEDLESFEGDSWEEVIITDNSQTDRTGHGQTGQDTVRQTHSDRTGHGQTGQDAARQWAPL